MTTRPRGPPAQLAAMPPRVTSSSGVGTYGGLKSCTDGHAATLSLQCLRWPLRASHIVYQRFQQAWQSSAYQQINAPPQAWQ